MKKIIAASGSNSANWWKKYYTKMTDADFEEADTSEQECQENFDTEVGTNYTIAYVGSVIAKPEYMDTLADLGYDILDLADDGNVYTYTNGRLYDVKEEVIKAIKEQRKHDKYYCKDQD
jgi:hypothetical protein